MTKLFILRNSHSTLVAVAEDTKEAVRLHNSIWKDDIEQILTVNDGSFILHGEGAIEFEDFSVQGKFSLDLRTNRETPPLPY